MLYSEIIAVCSEIHTKHRNSLCGQNVEFLGAFENLRKATISFVMSVRLSAWNNSAPTGRIFMKFHIVSINRKYVEKIQDSFKFDKTSGYFTKILRYICDSISLNSS
jgi:hypothetical protein